MRDTSSAFVKIFWLDRKAILEKLQDVARQMKASHPEIEEVLLFGSLARDEAVPGSDADLLLILSTANETFLERIPRYLPTDLPLTVDVFPYTRAEITSMMEEDNLFIKQALTEGIPL